MKMILTSDLHQMIGKWDDLVNLVRVERPRFVLIVSDLLPKDGGHKAQKEFFPKLKRHLQRMKEVASLNVYLYLGNDDHHTLEPLLDGLERERLCTLDEHDRKDDLVPARSDRLSAPCCQSGGHKEPHDPKG